MRPTAKHEQFARYLADGLSQEEAYIKAGFQPKNARSGASKLLQRNSSIKVRVQAILDERAKTHTLAVAKAAAKLSIDKQWLMERLVDVVEMGLQARPVLDSHGNPCGTFQQNLGAVNKAAELLGREFDAFTEKKEVRTGRLEDLSDEELIARANEAAAKLGVTLPKITLQ